MTLLRLSRTSRCLLKSSVPATSSSISLFSSQFILFCKPVVVPNHSPKPKPNLNPSHNPFSVCPSWARDVEIWSKRSEFHREILNSSSWSYRLIAGISSSSSSLPPPVSEGKSRKDEEKSSDLVEEPSWVDLHLPKQVRAYAKLARLDKPIGTWLLAWPCMWSITLAANPGTIPDLKMIALFGCGALLLRGAGCTINDLIDRDIDTKVKRTRLRPIASGLVTPFQGLSFLALQLLSGLGILVQLNNYSIVLGASSLLLVFSYPLMKRLTFWPQAYLGLTFNWGALLGWAAVKGSLEPVVVFPLYIAGVFWTLVYDTIYAHQDKEDDLKVGVKSTALRFGDSTKPWLTGFGMACMSSLAISGFNADIGWPYYASMAAASGQLAWQIATVDLSSRPDCNRKFVSNKWFGAIIFSGIVLGRYFQ